jgi:hypothetical protein
MARARMNAICFQTGKGRLFYDHKGSRKGGALLIATFDPKVKLTVDAFKII